MTQIHACWNAEASSVEKLICEYQLFIYVVLAYFIKSYFITNEKLYKDIFLKFYHTSVEKKTPTYMSNANLGNVSSIQIFSCFSRKLRVSLTRSISV